MVDGVTDNDRRSRKVLGGVVAFYLLGIVTMALLGHFAFIVKILVIPSLFIVAALTRQLRLFTHDWAIFLGLTIFFDSMRGLIFHLTMVFDRPVFMNYVIDAERFLFFGKLPMTTLQNIFADPPNVRFFEKFLVVVHGSHFVFFLLFALVLWYLRREEFTRFQVGMLLVMYGGLIGYFLVPTVPPWMADKDYLAIEPIFRFHHEVYNTVIPRLVKTFSRNPIAAMPSLHTAFPVYLSCVAMACYRRRSIPVLVYTAVVLFSLVYAGEHYVVELIAGVALGVGAWAATHRFGPLAARLRRDPGDQERKLPPRVWGRRLAIGAAVLAVGTAGGHWLEMNPVDMKTGRDFVERELMGRHPAGHYYLGRILEEEGKPMRAQREYELAAAALGDSTRLSDDMFLRLGSVAHDNGDHMTAIAALRSYPLVNLPLVETSMLGISMFEMGYVNEAIMFFEDVQRRRPGEEMSLYWLTRYRAQTGRISAEEVRNVAARLGTSTNEGILRLARTLEAIAARMP